MQSVKMDIIPEKQTKASEVEDWNKYKRRSTSTDGELFSENSSDEKENRENKAK